MIASTASVQISPDRLQANRNNPHSRFTDRRSDLIEPAGNYELSIIDNCYSFNCWPIQPEYFLWYPLPLSTLHNSSRKTSWFSYLCFLGLLAIPFNRRIRRKSSCWHSVWAADSKTYGNWWRSEWVDKCCGSDFLCFWDPFICVLINTILTLLQIMFSGSIHYYYIPKKHFLLL